MGVESQEMEQAGVEDPQWWTEGGIDGVGLKSDGLLEEKKDD